MMFPRSQKPLSIKEQYQLFCSIRYQNFWIELIDICIETDKNEMKGKT